MPASTSLRVIFVTGGLTALMCSTAYNAAIVALLSVRVDPIRSMPDLISRKYQAYIDSNGPTQVFQVNF